MIVALGSCRGQNSKQTSNSNTMTTEQSQPQVPVEELPWHDFEKMSEIANADYGKCYTIGEYQLCPERKLIKKMGMYGTLIKDFFGFFPDPSLQYGEDTMIIFAGVAFFDRSDFNIDWQTAQLLSYAEHYSEFTDGETLYYLSYGSAHTNFQKYDKNTYKFSAEKSRAKLSGTGFRQLTEQFHVKENTFCFGSLLFGDEMEGDEDFNPGEIWKYIEMTPIFEPFDVPNLRTIVSASGFETDYITDGRRVLYGGATDGYTSTKKDGKEHVVAEEWIIEGVDFATLRVLGKDLLVDKNALYCCTEVIPFACLGNFKFILTEM